VISRPRGFVFPSPTSAARLPFRASACSPHNGPSFLRPESRGHHDTAGDGGGEPIALVTREIDGDWQFLHHSADEPDTADARLVHVSHVADRDPSVGELATLPHGWRACARAAAGVVALTNLGRLESDSWHALLLTPSGVRHG
jgi:hypothetical protein